MPNYYVTMTDPGMSGWGMAEGLINKLIFVCPTENDRDNVMSYAKRHKMQNIRADNTPPADYVRSMGTDYKYGRYYIQIKTKQTYPKWYEG